MGRTTSQGHPTVMKAAQKRSEMNMQRDSTRAVIAKLARQASRVELFEKRLAEETAARAALEERVASLQIALADLRIVIQRVIT